MQELVFSGGNSKTVVGLFAREGKLLGFDSKTKVRRLGETPNHDQSIQEGGSRRARVTVRFYLNGRRDYS